MSPTRDRLRPDRARALLLWGASSVVLLSGHLCCGPAAAVQEASTARPAARPAVTIGPFSGRLTPARSAATFRIPAKGPSILTWAYKGPDVRFLITQPDGDVDGPGITPPYALPRAGRYMVAISSDTMAEGIYGPYRITFRLRPSP